MTKSFSIPYDTMIENIRQGEHWVRNDWKENNKYVMLADDRQCTPCLLLVLRETNDYYIYRRGANDYKYNWHKL